MNPALSGFVTGIALLSYGQLSYGYAGWEQIIIAAAFGILVGVISHREQSRRK